MAESKPTYYFFQYVHQLIKVILCWCVQFGITSDSPHMKWIWTKMNKYLSKLTTWFLCISKNNKNSQKKYQYVSFGGSGEGWPHIQCSSKSIFILKFRCVWNDGILNYFAKLSKYPEMVNSEVLIQQKVHILCLVMGQGQDYMYPEM